MPKREDFVAHVVDQLEGLGNVSSRAMFGGHGIYVDGLITGLVVSGTLYLKVDDLNRARFEQAGGAPFSYHNAKTGRDTAMSYWTVPDDVLDDAAGLVDWARTSHEASLRAKGPSTKPRAVKAVTAVKAVKASPPSKSPRSGQAKRKS